MAEIKSLEENNAPREKREKLISGEAKTRKRLGDVFIAEDVRTVKNHIFMDVVVPAIKTVIVDIVTNGIKAGCTMMSAIWRTPLSTLP